MSANHELECRKERKGKEVRNICQQGRSSQRRTNPEDLHCIQGVIETEHSRQRNQCECGNTSTQLEDFPGKGKSNEVDDESSSTKIISAASLDTSVPLLPMEIPISAIFKAGASFTPSPVIATTWPFAWKALMMAILCLGLPFRHRLDVSAGEYARPAGVQRNAEAPRDRHGRAVRVARNHSDLYAALN
ncbi:hypothetical protein BC937DRAFT_92523 [Endogone sp. FLAS-F59071]|nr:hypothetical protein BC937DRAFT_92523 [Endogone sp. FLAS-F59071]|eukprot:RUS15393.1 hypothetical protein BC937DRAFT_92523 [Endogone sp. FLAS-F59071]